jgi:hypothetical protein
MQTKFKIVETPDYILAVSDEKIKINDLYYLPRTNNVRKCVNDPTELNLERHLGLLKIISYQPKNNAPELDLSLLPEIVVEDDVEKFVKLDVALDLFNDQNLHLLSGGSVLIKLQNITNNLQKAATKIYSEEDLINGILYGMKKGLEINKVDEKDPDWVRNYVKSLKQPRTPKWFVAEMEDKIALDGHTLIGKELKTTTINGKTYLVGKFVNE